MTACGCNNLSLYEKCLCEYSWILIFLSWEKNKSKRVWKDVWVSKSDRILSFWVYYSFNVKNVECLLHSVFEILPHLLHLSELETELTSKGFDWRCSASRQDWVAQSERQTDSGDRCTDREKSMQFGCGQRKGEKRTDVKMKCLPLTQM